MSSKKRVVISTDLYVDNCTYTWTIENYSLIKFSGKIVSQKFGVGSDDKPYFQLRLHPEGKTWEDGGYISLFLEPVIDPSNKPVELVCTWTVSAINDKKVIQKLTIHHDFAITDFKEHGWGKFYQLAKIDQLISSENTVTFQCELEILNDIQSSVSSDIICSKDETIDTIKFDFPFDSEKLSDVKLIVEEQEIPAHKIVLAAVSPVFRAMFTHDMLENNENSVKITDITKDIVTEMLRYIYTGEIDAIETDQIIELLAAADKYQIDNLKIKCGKMLCDYLSSQNAIKIL